MKKVLNFIKNKLAFLLAVAGAAIVGGATTAIVMAAIPDSNGVIHSCRLNLTGAVRIIDSASQSCNGLETAVNWDQFKPLSAYGHIEYNSGTNEFSLDSNATSNIEGIDGASNGNGVCLEISFAPKNVQINPGAAGTVLIRGVNDPTNELDESVGPNGEPRCNSSDNVFVPITDAFFIYAI